MVKLTKRSMFSFTLAINTVMAFAGIWAKWFDHLETNATFRDIAPVELVYLSIGLLLFDILNYFFIPRTKMRGVLVNTFLGFIGIYLMIQYAVIPIGIRTSILVFLVIIDILNAYIGFLSLGATKPISKKPISKKPK